MTGKEVKTIRRYLRITQAELARATGLKQSSISKLEKNGLGVWGPRRERIAKFFEKGLQSEVKHLDSELEWIRKQTEMLRNGGWTG